MWLFHSEKLVCWKQIITKLILKNQTLTVSSLKKCRFAITLFWEREISLKDLNCYTIIKRTWIQLYNTAS